MKRLVAAAAAALLLGGCASGGTGHLNPEISPDLVGPRSTQEPTTGTTSDDEDEPTSSPSPTASPTASPSPTATAGGDGGDVETAFADAAGGEEWYADVTAVEVDGPTVLVSTSFVLGDPDATAACEAAFGAAEGAGIASPSVEVRDSGGQSISARDGAAGDEACSEGAAQ